MRPEQRHRDTLTAAAATAGEPGGRHHRPPTHIPPAFCPLCRVQVVSPITEEVIGTIPAATAEDVEAAVAAADAAVRGKHWTTSSGAYRARYLRAIADKVTPCA